MRTASTLDGTEHGRIEYRHIRVISVDPTNFDIPHIKQVALLTRYRETLSTEKKQLEVVYLIDSRDAGKANAEDILRDKRAYWDVENKLHYRKDFVFGEDRQTARKGSGPRVLSALRNLAISILHLMKVDNVKRCIENLQRRPNLLLHALCI